MAASTVHLARHTDLKFIKALIEVGDEDLRPDVGDMLRFYDTSREVIMRKRKEDGLVLLDPVTNVESFFTKKEIGNEGGYTIVRSARISRVWESNQQRPDPDGVAYADGIVDSSLVQALNQDFQRLIENEPVDYHPGSGTRVRDLVHPSLYPFVAGRSIRNGVATTNTPPANFPRVDRFGRTYEWSQYQWLPSHFTIAADGAVTIPDYINNLDRARYPSAYLNLASLFSTALPLIESVIGYVESSVFFTNGNDREEYDLSHQMPDSIPAVVPFPLRGRELLVIPKIVEYRLGAEESHEGVWHVEGMSHEHIVATCLYILSRDSHLEGGDLLFKRNYTESEAGPLYFGMGQVRPQATEDLVYEGVVPAGRLATPEGRLLVFPNSHIHKLTNLKIKDGSDASEGRRRIIVFWIVDPSKMDLPSTRDVLPQQQSFTKDEALAMRLELMDERKRHKQDFNIRTISLCEH